LDVVEESKYRRSAAVDTSGVRYLNGHLQSMVFDVDRGNPSAE